MAGMTCNTPACERMPVSYPMSCSCCGFCLALANSCLNCTTLLRKTSRNICQALLYQKSWIVSLSRMMCSHLESVGIVQVLGFRCSQCN